MGKSIHSTARIQELAARIVSSSSDKLHRSKQAKPISRNRISATPKILISPPGPGAVSQMEEEKKKRGMVESERVPLSLAVSDCVKRWFQDTLREAKSGDSSMQVLVGQMYNSGYGVAKDTQKGRAWINRASKSRSSVWKVCDKQPGYNASDSDSEETKLDAE